MSASTWHHGDSGIGTDQIPAVHAEVATVGLGEIRLDGRPVAVNVPIHVMTGSGHELGGKLELDVGDPGTLIPGIPDGHLRVIWDSYEGGADTGHGGPYAVGLVVLVGLLIAALWINADPLVGRHPRTAVS